MKKNRKKQPAKRPSPPAARHENSPRSHRRPLLFAGIGGGAFCLTIVALAIWTTLCSAKAPIERYEIVHAYPHDPQAFTQGLLYDASENIFYESTGEYGSSSIRRVEIETGRVTRSVDLNAKYFAEGLAAWKDTLIQLTFKEGAAFVYDKKTFKQTGRFSYKTQGWGLTSDDKHLIMSDGSSTLRFLDPETFQTTRQIKVIDGSTSIHNLNELEYVRGEIYANIWRSNRIARVSPRTGRVLGWIDLGDLARQTYRDAPGANVLNGIAYDPHGDRLFVTGKMWPKLYQIRIVEK